MESVAGVEPGSDPVMTTGLLSDYGVKTVVVTLGNKGSLVCHDGECDEIAAIKVNAVDTTAAGDTFCAALCVALAEGAGVAQAAQFGNLAAAITVTRAGAQQAIPTREEVENLAQERGLDLK